MTNENDNIREILIEEAKKEERERIIKIIKNYSMYSGDILSIIEQIEEKKQQ